ncbi:low temperature requirement protein LtrA [Bifidobacterium commune]|uniref:Uncharacterized protein n=1 Tax=Bifidobacterium commune TaxID=1505727 RepID=A0A1C4H6R7_9BIFI|nr:low temperature requirement protein LtrA [Bifidobacterium commune]SCC80380.1 hypothetical protein GA0061077_1173 [Bifidobacterium commune]
MRTYFYTNKHLSDKIFKSDHFNSSFGIVCLTELFSAVAQHEHFVLRVSVTTISICCLGLIT